VDMINGHSCLIKVGYLFLYHVNDSQLLETLDYCNYLDICETWDSHAFEDFDVRLPGCNAVWICRYCPQITSWSPQVMLILRQCTVPRAEVGLMFVTIQRENIHPSKKEMNKTVTMLKLPDICSWTVNQYISLSLTNRKSSVHLHAL
jgi:hypothetical protein